MKLGIIGLTYSGKTTLFEAVTGAHGAAVEHAMGPHSAAIHVPDDRLDALAARCSPKKVTRANIEFMDVQAAAAAQNRSAAVAALMEMREADGLVHVVRFFEWPSAPPHPKGSLDPKRDAADMEAELILADLELVERRIERLEKAVVKPTPEQEHQRRELALMRRLKEGLHQGRRIEAMDLSPDESQMLSSFQFLSRKPQLHVLNVHEDRME